MNWRGQIAYLTVDPGLFFSVGNTEPAFAQIEEAKAVCVTCAALDVCLRWALDNNQDSGVWGGTSKDECRALERRNARQRRVSST